MFYNVQLKGVSILTRAVSDHENEKTMNLTTNKKRQFEDIAEKQQMRTWYEENI